MTTPVSESHETVLVVSVTFESADLLPGFIDCLSPGLGELSWHLVVADNNSTDGSAEVVRRLLPAATVVETGANRGYAAGINAALAAAPSHTAVLVLNPDVRLDPGCVPALLAELRRTRAGVAVPRLRDAHGELIYSMRRTPTISRTLGDALLGTDRAGRSGWGEMVTDPRAYDKPAVADWAEGSTQLVSAECWAACGAWDESYFLYSEETDFHLRAGDAGYPVRYVPTAGAVHLEGGSATSARLWPLLVANKLRLYRRRSGWLRATAFWAVLLVREGSRAVLGRRTSRAAVAVLVDAARLRAPRSAEWLDT